LYVFLLVYFFFFFSFIDKSSTTFTFIANETEMKCSLYDSLRIMTSF
jgi:hypothetical protein